MDAIAAALTLLVVGTAACRPPGKDGVSAFVDSARMGVSRDAKLLRTPSAIGVDRRPGKGETLLVESLYEHAGGAEAIHRLEEVFYSKVLADPLLSRLFPARIATHADHLTAFTGESFGGPDTFTKELGFQYIIDVHRGLKITEEERQRFVRLYLEAAEEVGFPEDPPFRQALREHLEFGSHVAMQNSNAETDDELHPIRELPRWTWPEP